MPYPVIAVLGDYIMFTAIALAVLTVVALILACSATYTFKDSCRKFSVCCTQIVN